MCNLHFILISSHCYGDFKRFHFIMTSNKKKPHFKFNTWISLYCTVIELTVYALQNLFLHCEAKPRRRRKKSIAEHLRICFLPVRIQHCSGRYCTRASRRAPLQKCNNVLKWSNFFDGRTCHDCSPTICLPKGHAAWMCVGCVALS